MIARLALPACALLWASPGTAAAAAAAAAPAKEKAAVKAPAKGEKAAAAKGGKAKKGEEPAPNTVVVDGQPPGDDPEFAKAGKVIEFDPSGKAKVVRGTDTGSGELSGNAVAEELPPPMDERQGQPVAATGQEGGAVAVKKGPGDLTAKEGCKLRLKAQCSFLVKCSGGAFPIDCEQMTAGCDELEGLAGYSKKDAEACAKGVKALSCGSAQAMGLNYDPEAKVAACKPIKDVEGTRPAPKPIPGVPGLGQDFRDVDVDIGGALGGGSE